MKQEIDVNKYINHYLARHMCTLDDTNRMHERSLYLTVFLKNKADAENVKIPIYLKVNKVIHGRRSMSGTYRTSMTICFDVDGSRENRPNLINPCTPHLHAIITLPLKVYENLSVPMSVLGEGISKEIIKMKEVGYPRGDPFYNIKGKAAKVEPMVKSIRTPMDYTTKAHRQAYDRNVEFDQPSVFPYDIHIMKKPDTKETTEMIKGADEILSNLSNGRVVVG